MEDQGFVNYVYEWWHYSYGDKYWGYVKNKTAIYDTVEADF
jgi:D-alanyl-D-alanine dipeptidase